MTHRTSVLALASAALLGATALGAQAATLRYANQGDLKSLDPYTLNETTANAHLGHVYEGLTKRGKDLAIEPGLAESWEILDDGKRWRFKLREGVTFQNGNPFTADDVLFSADRVRASGSNFQTRVPADATFVNTPVGVKRLTPADYMTWVRATRPHAFVALADESPGSHDGAPRKKIQAAARRKAKS